MRNCSGVDSSSIRNKFTYSEEQQHLDPIAEYEDELDLEYAAEDDIYDENETVDEEEYQYFDNERYVLENRKRYIKPIKSREMHAQPTRANYIYKKKEIESGSDRAHRKPHTTKLSLSTRLSPATSKSKVESAAAAHWNKPIIPVSSSYQRTVNKGKKSDGPIAVLNSLNALREKMFPILPNLTKPAVPNMNTMPETILSPPLAPPQSSSAMPATNHHAKTKRRTMVATEQIHHDSGDGPRVNDTYKMNLSELLKLTDESNFGDNEIVANLVNDINLQQKDNMRKISNMERQKKEMDQYYPTSLNLENFRQQMERKIESDQQQSSSSAGYQAFSNSGFSGFPQSFLESLNFPVKKNSSTQTNLDVEDVFLSDHVFKPEAETKYDEAGGQDENDNQNWNADDVSNLVSSSKEDLTELENLQNTKRMICELINKEIEKIAKSKNLDMSVSRRFLLQDRESLSCSEDFRKTRLDTLNNLQNEIKKLITLETVDE